MSLAQKTFQAVKSIVEKGMCIKNERQLIIYDRQSKLSSLLADAYKEHMPKADFIDFDTTEKSVIQEKLESLESGDTVILVQSTNFRLDNFRIRLNLFNRGIGCLEHAHLAYIYEHEYETYVDAVAFRGDYYKDLGLYLKEKLDLDSEVKIESYDGSLLTFGAMEDSKLNTGLFAEQKSRGGAAMCGEVFSEAQDFSTVNGEMSIFCYPGDDLRIIQCEPFKVQVKESFISSHDPKCPKDFRENILDRIEKDEKRGGVFMRELGFGLNPAITKEKTVADVNAFERMAGVHVSLGMKHQIYRNKFKKEVIQRYHIDIFVDTKRVFIDDELIFENGKYLFDSLKIR